MNLPLDPKPTLLAVDDDPSMRTLVRQVLEAEGYTVHTAPGAPEAQFMIAELRGEIHLLLTDIAMPGGMGTDLVEKVRRTHPAIRILYVSRYSREDLRAHGMDLTGNRLLPKPFTPPQLLAAVRDALRGEADTIVK